MKAAVFYGTGDMRYEEVPDIKLVDGEDFDVLIKVKAAGICGSDLHFFNGLLPTDAFPEKPVLGHELSGEVVEVGKDVKNVKVGDRVAVEPLIECGKCIYCKAGDYHLCGELKHIGYFYSGGFAEYTKAPHGKVFKLPDSVSYEEASLVDCYACGVHAVNVCKVSIADFVVVFGAGPVGLTAAQAARAAGARDVVIIDDIDEILEIAKQAGIEKAYNSSKINIEEKIMELTNGLGADIVIDAGRSKANVIDAALPFLKFGGRIGVLSLRNTISYNAFLAHFKEIKIEYIFSYAKWNGITEFEIALNMIARGDIIAAPLVTHQYSLKDVKEAFSAALNKKEFKAIKIILKAD